MPEGRETPSPDPDLSPEPPAETSLEPSEPPGQEAPSQAVSPEMEPTSDLAGVREEEVAVEEAASRPAVGTGRPRDRGTDQTFLFAIIGLAILLFFGWIGGTAILQLRRDARDLRRDLSGLASRTEEVELRQARSALLRVRAELEVVRENLPPDLQSQVERAEEILEGVTRELKVAR